MNIRILFFGATADEAGTHSVDLTVDDNCSTGEAFDHVLNRFPQLSSHKLLFALNQEYVSKNARMGDADELAIFTAVSGG